MPAQVASVKYPRVIKTLRIEFYWSCSMGKYMYCEHFTATLTFETIGICTTIYYSSPDSSIVAYFCVGAQQNITNLAYTKCLFIQFEAQHAMKQKPQNIKVLMDSK